MLDDLKSAARRLGADRSVRSLMADCRRLLSERGATIIDAQGWFKGCMVLLRPGASTLAQIGAGQGARHSSAAKMSAEAGCLAITVSQDGPITLYDSGRKILSL